MKVPFGKILVYLDGSEESISALMYSILLAKSTGAELHAVYVVNTKALSELVRAHVFITQEKSEYLADLRKDSARHIRHAERLAGSKDQDIIAKAIEGSPAFVIQDYIKANDIDLLAIGPVNAIRSRRDEPTSENDRMMRTVPCQVLIVRDDSGIWEQFEG